MAVALAYFLGLLILAAMVLVAAWWVMIRMPGDSHEGPLPPLETDEASRAARLQGTVEVLAKEIGERNAHRRPDALVRAAEYIASELEQCGFEVVREPVIADGVESWNLICEVPGRSPQAERVIVGAHYDTVAESPGADDNASAVAAGIELARHFRGRDPMRPLRFVFFPNEEIPYFMTPGMGSLRHVKGCLERREQILGMICLETIGFYSEKPGSQRYPFPLRFFYPQKGDFIAFVGNLASRRLVRSVVRSFRLRARFPSTGIAATELIRDICRSDHYPFWRSGIPAVMVTDTADFRNPHYHLSTDKPDRLDYERLSRVVGGIAGVLEEL